MIAADVNSTACLCALAEAAPPGQALDVTGGPAAGKTALDAAVDLNHEDAAAVLCELGVKREVDVTAQELLQARGGGPQSGAGANLAPPGLAPARFGARR
jgi:hypothetical protein